MTTAGYLISRAAEHPPILELTTVIVAVRFFALGRPLARYLERLSSHDVALRGLGRARSRVYERIEPLAPAELAAFRRGDLLTRLVADVDALQNLTLRALSPAVVALLVGLGCVVTCALVLPWAAVALAVGLALAGIVVPLLAGVVWPGGVAAGGGARGADGRARRAPARRSRARGVRPRGRGGRPRAGGGSRARPPRPSGCARRRARGRRLRARRGADRDRGARGRGVRALERRRSTACSSRCSRCSLSPRSTPCSRSPVRRASSPRPSPRGAAFSTSRSASRRSSIRDRPLSLSGAPSGRRARGRVGPLSGRPARARRLRPPTRAGRAHRAGRTERGGEDHRDEPPAPVPRPGRRDA